MYFPLHPETPDEGKSLEELFAGRGMDLDAMYQRMKGLMDDYVRTVLSCVARLYGNPSVAYGLKQR